MTDQHPPLRIVGLCGKAGSGKDTVRAALERQHGFAGMAFADPLKAMLGELVSMASGGDRSLPHWRCWLEDRHHKEQPHPVIGASYRRMAQTLGTEWGRQIIGPDLWLNVMRARIEQATKARQWRIVISDVRFANEASLVRSLGGSVWCIERPGIAAVAEHVSEAMPFAPDYTLHNDDALGALPCKVRQALAATAWRFPAKGGAA